MNTKRLNEGHSSSSLRVAAWLAVCVILPITIGFALRAQQRGSDGNDAESLSATTALVLVPTTHPALSGDLSKLWFAPALASAAPRSGPAGTFVEAMKLADRESYAEALPLLDRASAQEGVLGDYAAYYAALARLRLGRPAEAQRAFTALHVRPLVGYLAEAVAFASAECAEALGDHAGAVAIYERLARERTTAPEEVLMRLGGAARAAGDLDKARDAFSRVYFGFPLSTLSPLAGTEYTTLPNLEPLEPLSRRHTLEMGRAERLFNGRKYVEARNAFEKVRSTAVGLERDLVLLRLAESDYLLGRLRVARDGLRPFADKGPHQAEALYYLARTLGDLGDNEARIRYTRTIADRFPGERWSEESLNSLATHYLLVDDETRADAVFRELQSKYPNGIYGERSAWKAGWRAYRQQRYAETVTYFERAAANFPRSDYRPSWLYWSGRAHERLGNTARAEERFMLAASDYLNSYYGRLAVDRLKGRRPPARVIANGPQDPSAPLPNELAVRSLLDAQRYEDALKELQYAQRAWGDSSSIQATISWIQRKRGQTETGTEQFNLLRGSITTMRRAYPQFMAAGGENLPKDVLTHIFPLEYWDLIQKYSAHHRLDRFLVAALVAQESTFVPAVRSSAGAVGLMQLMPATARVYARRLKLSYSRNLLTNPEASIRIGTAYLADKIKEFGEVHLALASYNAGERAVREWKAERPGLPRDEFIDDIPYPETQNYLKRILGTAEDYRRLYGS